MKIYIDPRCDIRYASFYIKGLYDNFGKSCITFSAKYSKQVSFNQFNSIVDRTLLITIFDNDKIIRIVIDSRDPRSILTDAYNWCDYYFKSNYKYNEPPELEKVIIIPPSFAINIWNPTITLLKGFYHTFFFFFTNNYGNKRILFDTFKSYIYQITRRKTLKAYDKRYSKKSSNYIFIACSLWNYKECIEYTNTLRFNFMKLCKTNPHIDFEGGFIMNKLSANIPVGWERYCKTKRISPAEYINKTQHSFCVFNTPAVRECHGWKLPEFLCMGKAIISTPPKNDLTEPLKHGHEIYLINNESELSTAINILLTDTNYRNKLEINARLYWEKYCAPQIVIKNIFAHFRR